MYFHINCRIQNGDYDYFTHPSTGSLSNMSGGIVAITCQNRISNTTCHGKTFDMAIRCEHCDSSTNNSAMVKHIIPIRTRLDREVSLSNALGINVTVVPTQIAAVAMSGINPKVRKPPTITPDISNDVLNLYFTPAVNTRWTYMRYDMVARIETSCTRRVRGFGMMWPMQVDVCNTS